MDLIIETLTNFFVEWGYVGLFISAFVAGSILPFSSEIVLIMLVKMGLDPILCLLFATSGNTLGGMTCYWIGRFGDVRWIKKLGVSDKQLDKANNFLKGKGSLMALFAFLPYIGEAIAIVLGIMRSNVWLTLLSMFIGKLLRYAIIFYTAEGIASFL